MQQNIPLHYSFILILLIAINVKAQLPFHYYIDNTGKVQLIQITGEPYEVAYYRTDQPLATLKLTKDDSSKKVIRSEYVFDNNVEKLRTEPSNIDTLPRLGHDFSGNISINRNYLKDLYPFWQDNNNSLFKADIQKGKYYYEYSYIHYSPSRSRSMPPPGPAGSIPQSYTPVLSKWYLDSNYRIANITNEVKDPKTGRTDSSIYDYSYTNSGLIKKVVQKRYLMLGDGRKVENMRETYFFYTAFNKPMYIISIWNNLKEPDEEYCSKLLDTMKAMETVNTYSLYQDTPVIAYFAAYNYDVKNRFSSCINFDLSEHRTSLTVDSVTYNQNNLPDTIDEFSYNSKDQYGSRIVIIYNKHGKVAKIIENSYRQWFRNFKSQVAYLQNNKFTYDKEGRIIDVSIFFNNQIDVSYRYLY